MLVKLQEELGVPVLMSLTILGAETSLGDPNLGGQSVLNYNYGCLKWMGTNTPWGALSSGKDTFKGDDWYVFPDAATGVWAWGLYITKGPTWNPGYYLQVYPDWRKVAALYYGDKVAGYEDYVANLTSLYSKFTAELRKAGFTVTGGHVV